MNVGVVCCKNCSVVSTEVAAQGRVDKYILKSGVYSRIPYLIFHPLSTTVHSYKVHLNMFHLANHVVL